MALGYFGRLAVYVSGVAGWWLVVDRRQLVVGGWSVALGCEGVRLAAVRCLAVYCGWRAGDNTVDGGLAAVA